MFNLFFFINRAKDNYIYKLIINYKLNQLNIIYQKKKRWSQKRFHGGGKAPSPGSLKSMVSSGFSGTKWC